MLVYIELGCVCVCGARNDFLNEYTGRAAARTVGFVDGRILCFGVNSCLRVFFFFRKLSFINEFIVILHFLTVEKMF